MQDLSLKNHSAKTPMKSKNLALRWVVTLSLCGCLFFVHRYAIAFDVYGVVIDKSSGNPIPNVWMVVEWHTRARFRLPVPMAREPVSQCHARVAAKTNERGELTAIVPSANSLPSSITHERVALIYTYTKEYKSAARVGDDAGIYSSRTVKKYLEPTVRTRDETIALYSNILNGADQCPGAVASKRTHVNEDFYNYAVNALAKEEVSLNELGQFLLRVRFPYSAGSVGPDQLEQIPAYRAYRHELQQRTKNQ